MQFIILFFKLSGQTRHVHNSFGDGYDQFSYHITDRFVAAGNRSMFLIFNIRGTLLKAFCEFTMCMQVFISYVPLLMTHFSHQ